MMRESMTVSFKSFCFVQNKNKNIHEIILIRGAAYTGIYPREGLLPKRIEHTVLMYSTAYNYMICTLWTPFQAERDWQNSFPRDFLNSTLIYILFSLASIEKSLCKFETLVYSPHITQFNWFSNLYRCRIDLTGYSIDSIFYRSSIKSKRNECFLISTTTINSRFNSFLAIC